MELTWRHGFILSQADADPTGTTSFDQDYERSLHEVVEMARELEEHGFLDHVEVHRSHRDRAIDRVVVQISEEGRAVIR